MEDYHWLTEDSITFLRRGYIEEGVDPKQRFTDIANSAEEILGIEGYAEKFLSYLKKGWYSLSSPIVSNFGLERGLSISCNGSYIEDSMEGILSKVAEVGMMTKHGSGTSGYFGALRERGAPISIGGKSNGIVHFMELFNSLTDVVSQSNIRRGHFAAYTPVEHPDIEEFLEIRSEGHPIQHMSIGVTITDEWMRDMIAGDTQKRKVWAKITRKRFESGYPYIMWTDTVNNGAPQVYKDKGMKIYASNMCTEICLPASADESFVCNLSSMNLLHWHEWKDTDAVEVLTYFLDAVMTDYIRKVKDIKFMEAAYNFAVRHRALGIGVLGWHSLLQDRMVSFESLEAKGLNIQIHKHIRDKSQKASREMAVLYGEPEVLKGYGMRNTTTMATAPTTSSSFIFGKVSQGREPYNSNYYTVDLAKGKFTVKNPQLKRLLDEIGQDTHEVWESILHEGGSVQHLEFLSDHQKDVFKTFNEISQREIVIQASGSQKYIDQAQSLNLMIPPSTSPKEVSNLMIFAWEMGVKTLYYQRGQSLSQELNRNINSCASCEA